MDQSEVPAAAAVLARAFAEEPAKRALFGEESASRALFPRRECGG